MVVEILKRIAGFVGMTGSVQSPDNGYTPRFRKVYDANGETLWALMEFSTDTLVLATGPTGGEPQAIVNVARISEVMNEPEKSVEIIACLTPCVSEV